MAYPASVERVTLTGAKQGQQKVRPKFLPGHDVPLDPNEPETSVGVGGPIVDLGRDGSVRLDRNKGAWRWEWIKGESDASRSLRAGPGVLLYPANRSLEQDPGDVKPSQVADAAVDYVRALPDVSEFASISDIIVEELTKVAKLPKLDVYSGDTLAVIENKRARFAKVLLAFPVGEVGNHLTASAPVKRFPTAILQICSSPCFSGHKNDRDCTALMVRVQTTTYMLNVDPHRIATGDTDSKAEVTRVGELHMDQTEGRRHVDMALDETSWSKALIVDEGGGVWMWQEEKVEVRDRMTKVMQLRRIRGAVRQERHGFYRIAFGSRPGTALVMSDRQLVVIDFEATTPTETTILELTGQGRIFAALEKTALARRASFTCAATNFEVMWVDELKVGPPVITWNHDWGSGAHRDFALSTFPTGFSEYTIMTCRSSDMTMVFETDSQPPARSHQHPKVFDFATDTPFSRIQSVVPLRIADIGRDDREASHLGALGVDGSLHTFQLHVTPRDTVMDLDTSLARDSDARPIWDDDIRSLALAITADDNADRDWQDKAATKHKTIDLTWVWQAINELKPDEEESFTSEVFEQYLRELDAPFDGLATLGDLARDAVSYSTSSGQRTHALLPLPIDDCSVENDLASLTSVDPTKYSLTPIVNLAKLDGRTSSPSVAPHTVDSLTTTFASGCQLGTSENDRIRRDTQRLVMDLVLSRTVVNSEDIRPTEYRVSLAESGSFETPADLFERTQQLTLEEKTGSAKRVDLEYLLPHGDMLAATDDASAPIAIADINHALQTPSARSLLGEWDLGDDPVDYTWKGWREAPSQASTPIRRPVRPLPSPRTTQRFPQSQPTLRKHVPVAASTAGFPAFRDTPQTMRSSPPPVLQSSQAYPEFGASTQVERGPFGGRLEGKKKKTAKKRVGGF